MNSTTDDAERPIRPEFLDDVSTVAAPPLWLSYMRLFRLPNVFTAIADVLMGYFVTTLAVGQVSGLLMLVLTSAFLYTAGMVLNDVFDVEVDRVERPSRPLPSGQISVSRARWIGFQLLAMGVVAGWCAGLATSTALGPYWRSGVVATALAAAVLAYNLGAKRTFVGPWVMGTCRLLNVLLGMSLNAVANIDETQWIGFGTSHLSIAGGLGLYIVGVTRFARSEATESPRGGLLVGLVWMTLGLAMLALFPRWHAASFSYRYLPTTTWPLGVAMISFLILRRPLAAIWNPGPRQVQVAVKNCILSLIVLNALLCSFIGDLPLSLTILALLIPTVALGKIVYST